MSSHHDVKQVILVRRDLRNAQGQKVRSGKLAAQVAHASMAWIGKLFQGAGTPRRLASSGLKGHGLVYEGVALSAPEHSWLVNGSFAKIVLGVDGEGELLSIADAARKSGLTAEVITDCGHTEFAGPTVTCAGIGPDVSDKIDRFTGHLKPY